MMIRAACVVAALALAGCGGAATKSSSTATQPPPAGGGPSLSARPVHASLQGQNHAPKVDAGWRYSLRVTDAQGVPLSGTVEIRFTFGGQVVGHDTPPVHPVKDGLWHDTLTFPAAALGQPLTVQAVVKTSAGSVTLGWPVKVRP